MRGGSNKFHQNVTWIYYLDLYLGFTLKSSTWFHLITEGVDVSLRWHYLASNSPSKFSACTFPSSRNHSMRNGGYTRGLNKFQWPSLLFSEDFQHFRNLYEILIILLALVPLHDASSLQGHGNFLYPTFTPVIATLGPSPKICPTLLLSLQGDLKRGICHIPTQVI